MSALDNKDDDDVIKDNNFASPQPMKHAIEFGVRRPFTLEEIEKLKEWIQYFVDNSSDNFGVEIKNDGPLRYVISYESVSHPYKDLLWGSISDTWRLSDITNIRWISGYRYNYDISVDGPYKHRLYPNRNLLDLSKDKKSVRNPFCSYNPILLAYGCYKHVYILFRSVGFLEAIASLVQPSAIAS